MLTRSNKTAVICVTRVRGDGDIASRTKIDKDAPTTKLRPKIKNASSPGKKVEIASITIAKESIKSSTNLGGLCWLDKITAFNQKFQNLINVGGWGLEIGDWRLGNGYNYYTANIES